MIPPCGVPASVGIQAIQTYVKTNNQNPKPFVWTKRVEEILEKVNHCKASTVTAH
jgi:hypothetical protein